MDKPNMSYVVRIVKNPQTGSEAYLPQITDTSTVELPELVHNAIDVGRITGYTQDAAVKEANALLAALSAVLKTGRPVSIDGSLKLQLQIDDTVKSEYSPLTAVNTLSIGTKTLSGYALSLDDFSWHRQGVMTMSTSIEHATVTALISLDNPTESNVIPAGSTAQVTCSGNSLAGVKAENIYLRRYVDGECVETVSAGLESTIATPQFLIFTQGLPVPAANPSEWTAEGADVRLAIAHVEGEDVVIDSEGPGFRFAAAE